MEDWKINRRGGRRKLMFDYRLHDLRYFVMVTYFDLYLYILYILVAVHSTYFNLLVLCILLYTLLPILCTS